MYCLQNKNRNGSAYNSYWHIWKKRNKMDSRSRDDVPKHRSDVFQYATSAWLALPYEHCLVLLLISDVPINVVGGTAIPTSNFIF